MKVIIPVAGQGTRLLPFTKKRQKCLLPVAGKPVLDHIVLPLIEQGFDEIVLVTGYLEEQLKSYVTRFDASFSFVRQEEQLGLGHAVFMGLENTDAPVLIQLGDTIYRYDFAKFCRTEHHRIAVDRVPDPERFGIVEVEEDRIIKVWEKPDRPPTDLGVVGLYYLSNQKVLWEILKYLIDHRITTKGEIQLADAFQKMVEAGEVITAVRVPDWFDCGVPETFLSTNRALLHPSGVSADGCRIVEPVSIGNNCHFDNCTIGPFATIMDGCRITNSRISDAIVLWDSQVEETTIRHAIVGGRYRIP